jgi:hypothetical protein
MVISPLSTKIIPTNPIAVEIAVTNRAQSELIRA